MKLPFPAPEKGEPNSEAYAKLIGNLKAIASQADEETSEALQELIQHWTTAPPHKLVHERENALRDAIKIWSAALNYHEREDEELRANDRILLRELKRSEKHSVSTPER